MDPLTLKNVLEVFDRFITRGQLLKLCEFGVIEPFFPGRGTGTNRLFDYDNLFEIAIWVELHAMGVDKGAGRIFLEVYRTLEKSKDFLVWWGEAGTEVFSLQATSGGSTNIIFVDWGPQYRTGGGQFRIITCSGQKLQDLTAKWAGSQGDFKPLGSRNPGMASTGLHVLNLGRIRNWLDDRLLAVG